MYAVAHRVHRTLTHLPSLRPSHVHLSFNPLTYQRNSLYGIALTKDRGLAYNHGLQAKPKPPSHLDLSNRRFTDAPISDQSKFSIRHEFMTEVQAGTLDDGLEGKNILIHADRGSGRTLAYLLPTVERFLRSSTEPPTGVSILVLHREDKSALMAEAEARKLAARRFQVNYAIGEAGDHGFQQIFEPIPALLIATPRKLNSLFRSPAVGDQTRMLFHNLQVLVLDDAEFLIGGDYVRNLDYALKELPPVRQSIVVAETFGPGVRKLVKNILGTEYAFFSRMS